MAAKQNVRRDYDLVVGRLGLASEGLVRIGCACYTTPEEIDRSAMHGIGTPEDLQAFLAHRAALAAAAAPTPVAA